MAITPASFAAKQRILSACVRLFLEKGYKRTTVAEILKAANVSASTFQNIFHAKDGVLIEFVQFMFGNQFNIARKVTGHERVRSCRRFTSTRWKPASSSRSLS